MPFDGLRKKLKAPPVHRRQLARAQLIMAIFFTYVDRSWGVLLEELLGVRRQPSVLRDRWRFRDGQQVSRTTASRPGRGRKAEKPTNTSRYSGALIESNPCIFCLPLSQVVVPAARMFASRKEKRLPVRLTVEKSDREARSRVWLTPTKYPGNRSVPVRGITFGDLFTTRRGASLYVEWPMCGYSKTRRKKRWIKP